MMAFDKKFIIPIIDKLEDLIVRSIELEKKYQHHLQTIHPRYQQSASNMLHYLTLRHTDLRQVQKKLGDLGITLTDYYFPEGGEVFEYGNDKSIHFLEASISYSLGPVGLMAGYFFSGDPDNSIYTEITYNFYTNDDVGASFVLGGGNSMYVLEDNFNIVNVGLAISKGPMSTAYIVNPDAETNFLVVGYSF